jgi:hypothetical protein
LEADLLYLSAGEPRPPARTCASREGHAVRYDDDGRVVAVNPRRRLLVRGAFRLTVPETVDMPLDDIERLVG